MTKTFTALAAAAVIGVAALSVPTQADARGWHRGGGVAAGVIGGLAAGAIIGSAAAGGGYYGPGYGYYGGPYYYGAAYPAYGGCYITRERIATPVWTALAPGAGVRLTHALIERI